MGSRFRGSSGNSESVGDEEKPQTEEALREAAYHGDLERVLACVARGVDVNAVSESGDTALLFAVQRGHAQIVTFLLKAGADVNCMDQDQLTPLALAAQQNRFDLVRMLVDAGADVGQESPDERVEGTATPLMSAAARGSQRSFDLLRPLSSPEAAEIADNLLKHARGKVSRVSRRLLRSAREGDTESLQRLLELGVNLEAKDKGGETALILAAAYGHTDVVRRLLAAGAKTDAQTNQGMTALLVSENADITGLLLAAGANPNHSEKYGQTALIAQSIRGDADSVALLLQAGADVTVQHEHYGAAAFAAAQFGRGAAIRVLIEKGGVDVNQRAGSRTLLMQVCTGSSPDFIDCVETLIRLGANVNLTDGRGYTALMFAAGKSPEIVSLLLEAGADPDAESNEYDTALQIAVRQRHVETLRLLIDAGANVNAAPAGLHAIDLARRFPGGEEVLKVLRDALEKSS